MIAAPTSVPPGLAQWPPRKIPCVFCGRLLAPGETKCPLCTMSQTPEIRRKAAEISGEWYILETPRRGSRGVNRTILLKQIAAGTLTANSVVKGPTTNGDWQLAGRTPGLARHLGICHHCDNAVAPGAGHCGSCGRMLEDPADPSPPPAAADSAPPAPLDGKTPCVFCGAVMSAGGDRCDFCAMSSGPAARARAVEMGGEWYVLDEPDKLSRGVNFAVIHRKAAKGQVKADTVVKSPTGSGEWRFAARTPGLAVLFGSCHACGGAVSPGDRECPACRKPVVRLDAPPASAPVTRLSSLQEPIVAAPVASAAPVSRMAPMSSAGSVPVVTAAPVMASPVMATPVMASPVMASPVMASPVMASPVMASPVMASPVMATPVNAAPVMATPVVNAAPVMATPVVNAAPVVSAEPLSQAAPVVNAVASPTPPMTGVRAMPAPPMTGVRAMPAPASRLAGPASAASVLPPLEVLDSAAATVPSINSGMTVRPPPSSVAAPAPVVSVAAPAPVVSVAAPSPAPAETTPAAPQESAKDETSLAKAVPPPTRMLAAPPGGGGVPGALVAVVAILALGLGFGTAFVLFGSPKPAPAGPEKVVRNDTPVNTTPTPRPRPDGSSTGELFGDYPDARTGQGGSKAKGEQNRQQRSNEIRRRLNDATAALQRGNYREAIESLGKAALTQPLEVPNAPAPSDLQNLFDKALEAYEQQKQNEIQAAKTAGGGRRPKKEDPQPEPPPTRNPDGPDPAQSKAAADLVRAGDAAAAKGDHHTAAAKYVEAAVNYPGALPDGPGALRSKFARSLEKLQNSVTRVDVNASANERKAKAAELRKIAESQADTAKLEVVAKTYTAIIRTGYYTADDVAKLLDLTRKLEKINGKGILIDD